MLQTISLRRSVSTIAPIILGYLGATPASMAQSESTAAALRANAAASREDARGALEEVVVTARKQVESLQKVPLSVVAVSGEQLERRSIENLGDLGQSTPNFSFGEQPQSGRVGGVAFIRGVGQRDPISAYDPAVGTYIDGIYMGRMYANNLDMMEVERVEVLRGPQGTLFGKNTSGGAISIATKQPDTSAFSGRIQVTGGSRDRLDVVGNVNIPLVADRLALQVAGARLTQGGYGERVDGQELADIDRAAARAQLWFQPTQKFSALLSGDWTQLDERNSSLKLVDTNPGIAPLAALNAVIDPDYDDRWLSPRDYFFNATGPNSARGTLRGASLTLEYDAGWATLKSITAYREMDVHNDEDPDGAPIEVLNKFENAVQDQFSQELQAAGSVFDDRLEWVAGLYYFHEGIDQWESYNLLTPLFQGTRDFARRSPIENDSIAVFAQGNYKLTDRLRITAGLRYTQDEKKIQSTQFGGIQSTQFGANGVVQFATPVGKHSSDAVSPRLGLDYQWTPQVMTYVSVAQGAKNGGFNGRVGRLTDFTEFDDEVVWTYEAGLRSDPFDGRVRFNVTAFYSEYSDLQLQISGSTVVNGAPASFGVITNIPKANIRGGEAELIVAPLRGLTLTSGLGLTYAKYTELPTDSKFVASRVINKESKFSNTPEVSYTLAAEYATAITDAMDITARVDYAHKSRIYYNAENTANVVQSPYGLLNARLTFEHAPSGVAVSLFGTNLTDEAYIVGGFDDAANPTPGLGFSIVSQAPPREWGVSAQVRF
jgi:iron complex outermembrane receptor protein